jgi:26S proteasome regulatory subunit N2
MHNLTGYSIQEPASGSPYQEGGALYALGMIHANHGAAIIPYLSEQLQTATNEVCYLSMFLLFNLYSPLF